LFKKSLTVPVVLEGNLRQQKSAVNSEAHQQAVPSDFNLIWIDWPEGRKYAE